MHRLYPIRFQVPATCTRAKTMQPVSFSLFGGEQSLIGTVNRCGRPPGCRPNGLSTPCAVRPASPSKIARPIKGSRPQLEVSADSRRSCDVGLCVLHAPLRRRSACRRCRRRSRTTLRPCRSWLGRRPVSPRGRLQPMRREPTGPRRRGRESGSLDQHGLSLNVIASIMIPSRNERQPCGLVSSRAIPRSAASLQLGARARTRDERGRSSSTPRRRPWRPSARPAPWPRPALAAAARR